MKLAGWIGLAVAGASIAAPLAAADAPPVELRPDKPWQLDHGGEMCRLTRTFGEGRQAVTIRLAMFGPHASDLWVIGQPMRSDGPFADVGVRFGLSGDPVKQRVHGGTTDGVPMVLFGAVAFDNRKASATAGDSELHEAPLLDASIRSIDVQQGAGPVYRLMTGPMVYTMSLARACADGLVGAWGYDPQRYHALARAPEPIDASAWIHSREYPMVGWVKGAMALIRFRLDVSANGRATGCHIQEAATQSPEFGKRTCALLMYRARFQPALGGDGKAVAAPYVGTVDWQF